ncbi:hypothetical protein [Aurantibacter sp.]|uniref:hypothetical protein n=1 Tax=Aurantibacter sp. TaxID=2807103 RepID=UPI003264C75F
MCISNSGLCAKLEPFFHFKEVYYNPKSSASKSATAHTRDDDVAFTCVDQNPFITYLDSRSFGNATSSQRYGGLLA